MWKTTQYAFFVVLLQMSGNLLIRFVRSMLDRALMYLHAKCKKAQRSYYTVLLEQGNA